MFGDSLDADLARILLDTQDGRASWFALTEGDRLFSAGDTADTLYVLRSGRLGVFVPHEGRPAEFVGVVRPGAPVGEMALLGETVHSAHVVALRDSEVIALPREALFDLVAAHPHIMTEIARSIVQRTRQKGRNDDPTVFGYIAARDKPIRPFVESIKAAVEADGYRVELIDREALSFSPEHYRRIEDNNDFVIYLAEAGDPVWATRCARQVDRLFIVGDPDIAPPPLPAQRAGDTEYVHQLTDLILLRRGSQTARASRWLEAMQPGRWFHCHEDEPADAQRMARLITNSAVGLVLSGGGARAYAHIGVLRALRAAKVPLDFFGGSSMGALIAAGPALGWDQSELESRIYEAFVASDPLSDIAFPLIAMTRAGKLSQLMRTHFGDVAIEDMARPFFAVSANLTTGRIEVHRQGRLTQALRASVAIPGVIPPLVRDGQVLVDGAVLRNFPSDVMRQINRGPMIGSDVSQTRGVNAEQLENPPSWWRWIMSGAWKQGPPIVSILMRAATLSTSAELAEARAETDVLIMPRPEGIDIREWKAYEPGIRAGEMAAQDALAQLDGPIEAMRRPAPKPEIIKPETEVETPPARTGLARLLPQRRPPEPKPAS